MGFWDNIRDAAEQFSGDQRAASDQAVAAALPPGTVLPRRVNVRLSPRFGDGTLVAFFGVVGLAPEDCYGVSPVQSNDITIGWDVYFRSRPEHEAGLASWATTAG